MELAMNFHLTPRDVDELYPSEFDAFVGSARQIRKSQK